MNYFLSLIVALSLWACGAGNSSGVLKNSDNAQLYQEVMDLHDSVMIKTVKDIPIARNTLRKELEQLAEEEQKPLLQAIKKLQKADDEMMLWMRGFKGLELDESFYQDLDATAIKTYLEAEKQKMQVVESLTLEALKESQGLRNN